MGKFETVCRTFQRQGLWGVMRAIAEHVVPANAISNFYKIKYLYRYGELSPKPNEIISVDPQKINKSVHWEVKSEQIGLLWNYRTELQRNYSFILDGEWDKRGNNFDEVEREKYVIIHAAIDKRFSKNVPWEETGIHRLENELTSDSRYANVDERVRYLDSLYESITDGGYKAQSELESADGECSYVDEITVAISRNGEFYWLVNGFHRLQLARAAESVESIPVRVGLRHEEWQEVRREIAESESVELLDEDKQKYLCHPDTKEIAPDGHSSQ